jgi:hypothetical protein
MSQEATGVREALELLAAGLRTFVWSVVLVHVLAGSRQHGHSCKNRGI